MGLYGLKKAESKIFRSDTTTDLYRVNQWLLSQNLQSIVVYAQSVRAIENSVALGLEKLDTTEMPELLRGESFYKSIIIEITEKERNRYNTKNQRK